MKFLRKNTNKTVDLKIAVNFAYNTAYQILTILIPLLTTPYLSRVLHADGIGQYSYSYAIAYYFVLFSMLGVNNYGNRSIAKVRDKKEELSRTFLCIYAIQLMSTILCSLAYIIYAVFFSNSQMAIIMIFYVVSAGLDINWLFWGLEEFKLTVTRNVVIFDEYQQVERGHTVVYFVKKAPIKGWKKGENRQVCYLR